MRASGHETEEIFNRYDTTDNRDKLGALDAARRFVEQQTSEKHSLVGIQR